MTLNLHTSLPIFIVSTPRSGSNIFLELVKRDYPRLKTFSEPDTSASIMTGLENAINVNKQFITKIHILHLLRKCSNEMIQYKENIKEFLLSKNTFKIAIKRRDIVAQIVSRYIAISRNKWFYNSVPALLDLNDTEVINIDLMQNCVDSIKEHTILLNSTYVNAEFYYEDIMTAYDGNVESEYNKKSPPPGNYNLLADLAADLLSRSNKFK